MLTHHPFLRFDCVYAEYFEPLGYSKWNWYWSFEFLHVNYLQTCYFWKKCEYKSWYIWNKLRSNILYGCRRDIQMKKYRKPRNNIVCVYCMNMHMFDILPLHGDIHTKYVENMSSTYCALQFHRIRCERDKYIRLSLYCFTGNKYSHMVVFTHKHKFTIHTQVLPLIVTSIIKQAT